ncbi:tetratricopeptide repeat protein [Chryseobacterium lactis]|nr:hypothetical protein [Chryseobacterium lactis]
MKSSINKYSMLLLLISIILSCHSSQKEGLDKTLSWSLIKESHKLLKSGKYTEYVNLQREYLKISEQNGYERDKMLCYTNLAELSISSGNTKYAVFLLKKTEKILETFPDIRTEAILHESYARLSRYLNMHDNSLYYNAKAIKTVSQLGDVEQKKYYLSLFYKDRGAYLYFSSQRDSCTTYFHKALELTDDRAEILCDMAEFYRTSGKLDSAFTYLQKAQHAVDLHKIADQPDYLNYHINLIKGKYYFNQHQYKESEVDYLASLQALNAINKVYGSFYFSELYSWMTRLYKEIGNKQKAHYYEDLYSHEKEKIEYSQKSILKPVMEKFIAEIKKDDEKQHGRMQYTIISLGILCLIIIIYSYRQVKTLQIRREILHNKATELQGQILDKRYEEILDLAKKNDSSFLSRFKEVYPGFITKLMDINPHLESSELVFCAMLKLNFSSKEIASYTFILHTSVQQRKRRLRRRLNISSEIDIYQFFNKL